MSVIRNDIHHLRDGELVIYSIKISSKWQFRFKDKETGKWLRFSTKTRDLEKAKEYAVNLFDEYHFAEKYGINILPTKTKFSDLWEKVKPEIEARNEEYKTHTMQIVKNWILPYFGDKKIEKVNTDSISSFYKYAQEKYGKEMSKSTIGKFNVVLNMFFDKAIQNKYIESKPKFPKNPGTTSIPRPYFSKEEYHRMTYELLDDWINKSRMKWQYEMRSLIKYYVIFLSNSGIRPGKESLYIKYRDFYYYKKDLYLKVLHSKTGKIRDIVCRPTIKKIVIPRLTEMFDDLRRKRRSDLFKLDRYVFLRPSFENPPNNNQMNKHFRYFLKEYSILYDNEGNERSLYSCRHSYITWAILDGIDLHTIKVQCGTSLQMIEKHYDKVEAFMKADLLTGRTKTNKGLNKEI